MDENQDRHEHGTKTADEQDKATSIDRAWSMQSQHDEEFADDITANAAGEPAAEADTDSSTFNSVFGWIGLALAIISYFMMPIILGGSGIILGFIARSRKSETLGNTAIIIGAISVLMTLFVFPFM